MIHTLKSALLTALLVIAGCGADDPSAGPAPKPKTPDGAADNSGGGATVRGWINWRGPHQNGTSDQTGLPDKLGEPLWTYDIAGRGSPVIANGRLYGIGYEGEGADLQEVLFCLDAESGEKLWDHRVSDFLSDVIYDRYSIGSPTVDPETGNIYYLSTPREAFCLSPEGKVLWSLPLQEAFGMNTYPNGRTGGPAIDGELVIFHGVSNNWGKLGPPADRFFAFDKRTAELVWVATPGEGPPRLKDSSFCTPYFDWLDGKRVFYSGDGSGNIVCVNARTGEQVWRYPWSFGGINSAVVLHDGKVIAVHGKENLDSSDHGGLIKLDPAGQVSEKDGDRVLDPSAIAWKTEQHVEGEPDVIAFTSSPVLVGDRVYTTVATGELVCLDATNGKRIWHKKLGPDQIHASPLYADGKLYVPINQGDFYVIKPGDTAAEVLDQKKLDGNCLGAPAVWNGKVYVHSQGKLYCFGQKRQKDESPKRTLWTYRPDKPGEPASLQIIPDEVLLRPGQQAAFRVRAIDAKGHIVESVNVSAKDVKWEKFVPPGARVRSEVNGDFNSDGVLVIPADAKQSAGSFKATATIDGRTLVGTIRGRVMADLPYVEDFERFDIAVEHETEDVKFAYPPLSWSKARFSWEIRELDGRKVLAKTLDRLILQRSMTFIGAPELSDYTFQADVMTDGNRRVSSDVGVINQRYLIQLKGNHQQLAVVSNQERVNVTVPFQFDRNKWYTLKSLVAVNEDGSGVVRAKAWERGQEEPAAWTIEVPLKHVHANGAPGLYGFAVNGAFRVYVDNIRITPNN